MESVKVILVLCLCAAMKLRCRFAVEAIVWLSYKPGATPQSIVYRMFDLHREDAWRRREEENSEQEQGEEQE